MMTKSEFLLILEKELVSLSAEERNKTITYYSELISDMIENGYTQEEAVAKLGDPKEVAREIGGSSCPKPIKNETPVQKELKQKKKIKAWPFVVGGILLAVIITVVQLIGWIQFDKSPRNLNSMQYDVSEIDNIIIDIDIDNLKVSNSTNNKIVLEYYTNSVFKYDVKLEEKTLEVNGTHQFKLFNDYDIEDYPTILYLPSTYVGNIDLENSAGLIQLESTNSFGNVDLENSAGLISLKNTVCNKLSIEQSAGKVEMLNVKSNETFVEASAGQVEFNNLDSNNIMIEVTTGSVRGVFNDAMTNYTITSSTTAGNSNIPNNYGTGSKKLVVETTLGNIDIKFGN